MSSGRIGNAIPWIATLACFVCVGWLLEYGSDLGVLSSEMRPGIGSVGRAQGKVKSGMTKDEVRALLGRPHVELLARPGEDVGDIWHYWDSRWLVGSKLSVCFGDDDRVIATSTWLV